MCALSNMEAKRQKLQTELDGLKTQEERNAKGQFSTPIELAKGILQHASKLISKRNKIRFIDPGFGTGAFFSALLDTFPPNRIAAATGYEIDLHYGEPAKELWKDTLLELRLTDFTQAHCPSSDSDKYNLIICNPPYVRHHHIINGDKVRLQNMTKQSCGVALSGLSGLYCYFMGLSHCWLKNNGIAGWLIPSEFMDVNYGQAIKEYLLNKVTLLQIHRFAPNDVQFDDALVSSAIVWFKNRTPPKNHKVTFTYGGAIDNPHYKKNVSVSFLANELKWTRFPLSSERTKLDYPKLSNFFSVKRGIATGDNDFFILTLEELKEKKLPITQFRPILPSPRYLDTTEVNSDENGYPLISKKLFVLDCNLSLKVVEEKYPELWTYLQEGITKGVTERYLCKHRKLWYSQENRPASQFYCTYIGRSDKEGKKPFRFILNHSKAIVANSYLILYPKANLEKAISNNPTLSDEVFKALDNITAEAMLDEGRVYGGGMHKIEPKELGNVDATPMIRTLNDLQIETQSAHPILFENEMLMGRNACQQEATPDGFFAALQSHK